ncbi:hypothetical protein E4T56_gene2111 [Termitomyces sp. T112]|nr:hypothetical protein E4T56_gene2111 [Termitomyces sp. T112]
MAGFPTWQEVKGVRSSTHVKHQIEANYWYHCLMFPRSLELSEDLIFEFRDLFIHSMSDQMVSETSVVPYNVDDLQKLVFLANSLQHSTRAGSKIGGSTCFISVFMYTFVGQRF